MLAFIYYRFLIGKMAHIDVRPKEIESKWSGTRENCLKKVSKMFSSILCLVHTLRIKTSKNQEEENIHLLQFRTFFLIISMQAVDFICGLEIFVLLAFAGCVLLFCL